MLRIAMFSVAAAVCAASVPALASDSVERAPIPAWVDPHPELHPVEGVEPTPMVVRYSHVQARVTDDATYMHTSYRVKLRTPEALQAGNISLIWNPDNSRQIVHFLRIHREGEVINVLENANFSVFQREGGLEQSMLDGLQTAALQIPGLRLGDEIEFASTLVGRDQVFSDYDFGALFLSHQLGAGNFRLTLEWDEGEEPNWSVSEDLKPLILRGDDRISINLKGPDRFAAPEKAPQRFQFGRLIQYSDFADWQAISRRSFDLYSNAAQPIGADEFVAKVDEIAQAYSTDRDRAHALLALVHNNIRYVYTGMNGGNLRPATLAETWDRRFGDCKGMTVMLLAGLRRLGIDAEPVLVSTSGGDSLIAQLPNPGAFDHVLVRTKIDGESLWLDGTRTGDSRLLSDADMPYWWVLPVVSDGTGIEKLDYYPLKLPSELNYLDIDASAGLETDAQVSMIRVNRGDAAVQLNIAFKSLPRDQVEAGLKQEFSDQSFKAQTVDWTYDAETAALAITVGGTMQLDWDVDRSGDGVFANLTLPLSGFYPPVRKERPDDQSQEAPYLNSTRFVCSALRLKLPKVGAQYWGITGRSIDEQIGGVDYYRVANLTKNTVELIRSSRTVKAEVSAAEARSSNRKIDDFDNSTAQISTWPGSSDEEDYGVTQELPNFDTIDWIAERSVCIP